jgi:8-oxo-dGTP pyrophosphatase MutT (NUDIX family)
MNRLDRQWIRERLSAHRPRPIADRVAPRRAAVASIFREKTDDLELMFIRRAVMEKDPWSGHMAFPGGQTDEGDRGPLGTARRETREEVGVNLEGAARLLGQLDDVIASARGRVLPMAITPFVFELISDVEPRLDRAEVEEVVWVPVSMLLDPAYASTVPYTLAGQRFNLPCFRVFDRVIWGLTYQMLMRMFSVLDWVPGR